ncbi:MAG: LemA family protein [bacterium]|nr:LemA family protein [bacterium]
MNLYIAGGLALVVIIAVVAIYNRLIQKKTRVDESWSDIDVQLKRRYDLIPNLVETVKGYATQEKTVFEEVTKARSAAMGAGNIADKAKAENMLSDTLKSLFAVAESYPTLRSSENFQKLQDELTDTENKIEAARRFYNGNVREFNIAVQVFPSNILARFFGFRLREFFETESTEEKQAPKVGF